MGWEDEGEEGRGLGGGEMGEKVREKRGDVEEEGKGGEKGRGVGGGEWEGKRGDVDEEENEVGR